MKKRQSRTAWITLLALIVQLALLAAFHVIEGNAVKWGIGSLIFLGILLGVVQTMKK